MIALWIPDPYTFVRAVMFVLATVWTIGMIRRVADFAERWETNLEHIGLSKSFVRRQAKIVALRATVLDPINLALFLFLVGSWTLRSLLAN